MPSAENRFQILNLRPKYIEKQKYHFLMDIYRNNTGKTTIKKKFYNELKTIWILWESF